MTCEHDTGTASEAGSFDPDLVKDFFGEFEDACAQIQNILIELEHEPTDPDSLHGLFRVLHSVKSNLRMMQLERPSDFVHALEDVLHAMRAGHVVFDARFSDVFLLSVEQVRTLCETTFDGRPTDETTIESLTGPLQSIARAENVDHHLEQVLGLLDGTHAPPAALSPDPVPDLEFFERLATFVEGRTVYRKGTTERTFSLAQAMNELAGEPVDRKQLWAATCVHDMGMAFLPLDLLHKAGRYDNRERRQMESHVELAANLLDKLQIWGDASAIVRQHHEQFDGQGYPQGLTGAQIHDGAKILAIVDTFESMIHERADRDRKRPVMRAVAEINAQRERQFDPAWVDVFNRVIRERYVGQRAQD